jgi:carnitine O-palmitoyltransferase 1, liver isoform
MAEAHQATSYSTSLIHEPSDANHDQEVLQLVWESGLKSWRRRFARFRTKLRNGVYPLHLESLWIIMGLVMAFHYRTQDLPFDLVNILRAYMPE